MHSSAMPTDPATADANKRKNFGRKLRAARHRARLTQSELANASGIGFQQVSHAECGRVWPSLPVYFKMCRALGIEDAPLTGR